MAEIVLDSQKSQPRSFVPKRGLEMAFQDISDTSQFLTNGFERNRQFVENPPPEHPAFSFLVHVYRGLAQEPSMAEQFIKNDPFFGMYIKLREGEKDIVLLPPGFSKKDMPSPQFAPFEQIDSMRTSPRLKKAGYKVLGTLPFDSPTTPDYKYKWQSGLRSLLNRFPFSNTGGEITVRRIELLDQYIKGESIELTDSANHNIPNLKARFFENLLGIVDDNIFTQLGTTWNELKSNYNILNVKLNEQRRKNAIQYLIIMSVLALNRGKEVGLTGKINDPKSYKPQFEFEQYERIDNVGEIAKIIAEGILVRRLKRVFKSKNPKGKPIETTVLRMDGQTDYSWPDPRISPANSVPQLLGRNARRTRPGCIVEIATLRNQTKAENPKEVSFDPHAKRVALLNPSSGFRGRYQIPGAKNSTCRKCPLLQEQLCPRVDFSTEIPVLTKINAIEISNSIDQRIRQLQKQNKWIIVTD